MTLQPLIVNGKVQGWKDKRGTVHVVLGNNEPRKLPCHSMGVWGYTRIMFAIEEVTCITCKQTVE